MKTVSRSFRREIFRRLIAYKIAEVFYLSVQKKIKIIGFFDL